MHSHLRIITPKLEEYLLLKQILVITGMRRVGKTTQLNHLLNRVESKNKIFLDLEDILIRKIFSEENYENVILTLEQLGINFQEKAYIFLDEIQLSKNISSVIKYLYDKHDIKFVVSGSSSFYLRNHFTESLAGRKIVVDLFPLTFREFLVFKGYKKKFEQDFDKKVLNSTRFLSEKYGDLYQEYINFGGFPEVVLADKVSIKKELLKDILNSYFMLDVTVLANFSDVGKIRDLLLLLTQRIGQKLQINKLANALDIRRSKIYEYLEFLQSTYVIALVSCESSVDNKVSAEKKVYFADTGMASFLEDVSLGGRFENSVYMNLVYEKEVTYYQTRTGREIDFILDGKIGLEVKVNPSRGDLANLKKRSVSAGVEEYYLVGNKFAEVEKTVMAWEL